MGASTGLRLAVSFARVAGLGACVIACAGCADSVPARIVVPADTLVINSTLWTPTGIRVLNREGELIVHPHVSFSTAPDSLLEVSSGGAVNCYDDGVGTVAAVAGALRQHITIVCRLVHRFSPIGQAHLLAGGAPAPLAFSAYDAQGRVMRVVRLRLFVDGLEGSSADVIALRHGLVYGLRPGTAMITAMSWGKSGGEVFVVDSAPCERRATGREERDRVPDPGDRRPVPVQGCLGNTRRWRSAQRVVPESPRRIR